LLRSVVMTVAKFLKNDAPHKSARETGFSCTTPAWPALRVELGLEKMTQ